MDGKSLAQYRDRVADLMQQKKALSQEIVEICGQANKAGLCTPQELRQLARESLKDPDELNDHLERMDALRRAVDPWSTTPLGKAVARIDEKESDAPSLMQ
jgi:hypothetical protein